MQQAWYKQFWPWFLIALPMAAVVASLTTFYIAATTDNDMVVESYYKKGKAINADLSLIQQAEQLGVKAALSPTDNGLLLDMTLPDELKNQPLKVELAHKTLARNDRSYVVTADATGRYRFGEDLNENGRWFIRISPMDDSWRLQEELQLPLYNIEEIDGK
ncbi:MULTISPECIES: FixH family protein [unclassified Agarivorans]|uniref:FixH family protein n=1 Tax=unclassified Agarivorans TaxID=2636026 RepID=UPI0026E3A4C0|nr:MULTISPECIES: FixH family protein [unclassified Agarivorans]MDO6685904.1 FixH family protein [Agarivorans sp. 3_MG-2023]MDO6713958.1 FixH family protein [Agarivorans sp. 2_MG-2023]MDO6762290.1 FixH family protein [Agarivorans sp. 1_MG-2023]